MINQIAQFVLPVPFRHKTVLACHDDFGHMGMDRTSGLLKERYFWPNMAADVIEHIKTYERCTHFKLPQERAQMIDHYCFLSFGIGAFGFPNSRN